MNEKKILTVNSGLACLLKDRQGVLDNYDSVMINSGTVIVSAEISAKLTAKGGSINSGNLQVKEIRGEIVQLEKDAVIDGNTGLKDLFVIAKDRLLVTKEGMKKLVEADGLMALGTVYYPESGDMAGLAKISGEKKAYPDNCEIFLGDKNLETLVGANGAGKKHIWVSGRLTALDKKTFDRARSLGLTVTCSKFFSYEGLNSEYGDMITCTERILVPDGYEITGKIDASELALYGPKIYADGNFTMAEKDIPALEEVQSIIVKGKATLPASAVKLFRSRGKADKYFVFEGRLCEINGFEQLTHGMLDASSKKGEKITYLVNGCIMFDSDVTAEDMECIASLSYNGTVLIPSDVKSSLAVKVKQGNGFMGDPDKLSELTGKNLKDLIKGVTGESGDSTLNLGTYILA